MSKDKQITAAQVEKNRIEEAQKKAKEVEQKVAPVIYNTLQIIAKNEPPIAASTQEEYKAGYEKVTVDVLTLFKDAGLTIAEIEYAMPRFDQIVKAVIQQISVSLNTSSAKILEKTFGKDFKDMTMNEMDDILAPKEEVADQE